MTLHELLTLITSIVALAISATSLIRSRKLAEDQSKLAAEQLALERITAELSRLQIKNISEQDALRTKPRLNVAITKMSDSSHFVIANTGQGSAFELNLELLDCTDNPIIDAAEKLPYPEMKPSSRVKLLAAMHMGSPSTYQVKLTWKEMSGEQKEEIFWVSR